MSEIDFILPLVVALFVSALATPVVARLALKLGVIDRPNDRKISVRTNMPLMGGVAVAAGVVAGIALIASQLDSDVIFQGRLLGFVLGGALILMIGIWDDRFGMPAVVKLTGQIMAAIVAFASGFAIESFRLPGMEGSVELYWGVSFVLSILWIVGVTNAINLIDGLDGLATGLSAIVAITLTYICLQADQYTGALVGAALIGATLGFLPYNFPPARIFLGDTGALYLGFSLSLLALEGYTGGYRKASVLTFVVPLLALAVPIMDTLLSIFRRLRDGRGIFDADRMHMHHRLLSSEGSQSRAVIFLYLLTACFCAIAVSFTRLEDLGIGVVLLAAVAILTVRLVRNMGSISIEGEPSEPEQREGEDSKLLGEPRDADS